MTVGRDAYDACRAKYHAQWETEAKELGVAVTSALKRIGVSVIESSVALSKISSVR